MIKYNLNNINDWNYGDDNIKKVYHHNSVCYQKIYGGSTPTPSFNGKWIATYEGGVTSSAECDASSAITYKEISLTDLVAVEIGDCVTTINSSAFYNCKGLTSVTIGSGVTSIGQSVFNGCSGLTTVTIPNSVTSIGANAFRNCTGLKNVAIPNSVTSIKPNAFDNTPWWRTYSADTSHHYGNIIYINDVAYKATSSGITSYVFKEGTVGISDNAFEHCESLTSITIPNSVSSIENYAFAYCSGLTSVTIGNSVTLIDDGAFIDCSSLTSVTVNATTPPTLGGSYVFYNTNNCPIYVPAASVEAYKAASGWSEYASRIQAIPT